MRSEVKWGFQHACDATPEGCSNADVLTPAVESNFTGVYSLYNEEDIKNTILDCQQCHQTGGPNSQKILRMQELVRRVIESPVLVVLDESPEDAGCARHD